MNNDLSRRQFLGLASVGIPVALLTMGCPAVAPLVLGVGVRSLSRVFWGAVRTRPALGLVRRPPTLPKRVTAKVLIEGGERFVNAKFDEKQIRRLQYENPPLRLRDLSGQEFDTQYAIYEDVGVVQSCYGDEPRILFSKPTFASRELETLSIGDEVGVFSLDYTGKGWYNVQTVNRTIGFIHGNCLEPLPPSRYYA